MRVSVLPGVSGRSLTFKIVGARRPVLAKGKFSLQQSFDPILADRIVSPMATALLVPLLLHSWEARTITSAIASGIRNSDIARWRSCVFPTTSG